MKIIRLTLGPLGTNCYILYNEESKEAMVFDPAENAEIINNTLLEYELNLKYIIITHAHCDHIGALDKLACVSDATVCIGTDENSALNDSVFNLCAPFGQTSPETKAEILLNDGDVLKLGKNDVKFIHTPGHTKGGICALTDNILISGDTLFFESVGRSDFPGGSASVLCNSIKTKLFVLPDETNVYPGHGDSTTIGHEKKNNPFIW